MINLITYVKVTVINRDQSHNTYKDYKIESWENTGSDIPEVGLGVLEELALSGEYEQVKITNSD